MSIKELLYQAIELKRNLSQIQYLNPILQRDKIIERLSVLLLTPVPKKRKDLCAFHNRIHKYREFIFTFLFHEEVPPDNNASKRAIRNVKVKQKVSGQFKTEDGAQFYAVIRSVTDTCIKNLQNVLDAFKTIAIFQPE
jgi:transposase